MATAVLAHFPEKEANKFGAYSVNQGLTLALTSDIAVGNRATFSPRSPSTNVDLRTSFKNVARIFDFSVKRRRVVVFYMLNLDSGFVASYAQLAAMQLKSFGIELYIVSPYQ